MRQELSSQSSKLQELSTNSKRSTLWRVITNLLRIYQQIQLAQFLCLQMEPIRYWVAVKCYWTIHAVARTKSKQGCIPLSQKLKSRSTSLGSRQDLSPSLLVSLRWSPNLKVWLYLWPRPISIRPKKKFLKECSPHWTNSWKINCTFAEKWLLLTFFIIMKLLLWPTWPRKLLMQKSTKIWPHGLKEWVKSLKYNS